MPRNGSGTYTLPAGNPVVTGTTISSTVQNNTMSDVATAITNSLAKDGQTTPTANLPMGGFKLTGLGAGSAATDSANLGQIQAQAYLLLGSVSGTDTITATSNPVIDAYASGQTFRFVAANTNTGAVTINLNSLGAKDITKDGSLALVAGDIVSGGLYEVTYDGTRFQIRNVSKVTIGDDSVTAAALADSALGFALINGTLTASVAGNALTIAIKTKAGADPSASSPVLAVFRNATLATGDYVVRSITAATSIVVSSGSTLGTTSGVQSQINVLAIDNAGTVELGVVNNAGYLNLPENDLISTTAEGGAGGADSISAIYSTTARSNVPYRNVGYIVSTQATAGTWASSPTQIQLTSFTPNRSVIVSSTAQASTSGTAVDFTSIPSWVKRITVSLIGVSSNGTSVLRILLGDAGGLESSGYLGSVWQANTNNLAHNTYISLDAAGLAASVRHGQITFTLADPSTNTWTFSGVMSLSSSASSTVVSGSKSLSDTLTRLRIQTDGSDTFDAGVINITYE